MPLELHANCTQFKGYSLPSQSGQLTQPLFL